MKKIAVLFILVYVLFSCSDEDIVSEHAKEGNTDTHTVTFALRGIADRNFSVQTRSIDTTAIDFSRYTVRFFLFERIDNTDDYVLKEMKQVDTDFFTITGLEVKSYRYLFVAAPKGFEYMLDAKDSKGWAWENTYPVSAPVTMGTTLYKNCYFPFIENEDTNSFWMDGTDVAPCLLPEKNEDMEIYGQGYILSAGMDFHTPIEIFLERQYGSIEVRLKNLTAGEQISAAIASNYYRIYLSQMVKNDINGKYTSQNEGYINSGGPQNSDYAETTIGVPIAFYRNTTAIAAEQVIRFHLPYTTAAKTDSTVTNEKHKAISLTLTIGSKTYTYLSPFPIYRNGVGYFVRKGDQLAIEFTAEGDITPGIDLEEDWD